MSEFAHPEIFRSILEALPTGVYLVDRDRKILFWNDGAEQITGYLRQDVVGHFLREHLLATGQEVKDVDSDPADPLSTAFRDGKSTSAHVSILHKEGYRVPIFLRTIPIRNERGAIMLVVECFEINISASERARSLAVVAELGFLDEALGIPSRSFMQPYLQEKLTAFIACHIPFGILLMQVDHLERLRETRGPGVVPAILRVVAKTIENALRPSDLVGRWSDNLFMAVLMYCKETEVDGVARRIMRMIARSEVAWWGDTFPLTAAFGGAGCREGDTLELLVARAEKSVTESIGAGGNHVTVLP